MYLEGGLTQVDTLVGALRSLKNRDWGGECSFAFKVFYERFAVIGEENDSSTFEVLLHESLV